MEEVNGILKARGLKDGDWEDRIEEGITFVKI